MFASSPITAITRSAPFAASTACWKAASACAGACGAFFGPGTNASNIEGTCRRISGPGAWAILAAGSFARRPSSTVTAAGTWPKTVHEPSVSARESARGPITATLDRVFGSGSVLPSLRSSTIDRCAARRASAQCSGSERTDATLASSAYGLSKRPMRTFTARTRLTASSRRAVGTAPSFTSRARCSGKTPLAISMSSPARSARRAASGRSFAKPIVRRFPTPIASLTTKPGKAHSSLSTSVSSQRFAAAGTSLRSM